MLTIIALNTLSKISLLKTKSIKMIESQLVVYAIYDVFLLFGNLPWVVFDEVIFQNAIPYTYIKSLCQNYFWCWITLIAFWGSKTIDQLYGFGQSDFWRSDQFPFYQHKSKFLISRELSFPIWNCFIKKRFDIVCWKNVSNYNWYIGIVSGCQNIAKKCFFSFCLLSSFCW